ncbi:MAG: ArsR/SmtB family transcription factor [Candidatus Scatovivens sp.]
MVRKIDMCDCNVIHKDIVEVVEKQMLSESKINALSKFYKVFGDSTKIKILWALDISEMCVCDLASLTKVTKSNISHQLSILKNENLVKSRRDGKNVYYSLADSCVKEIIEKGVIHTMNR